VGGREKIKPWQINSGSIPLRLSVKAYIFDKQRTNLAEVIFDTAKVITNLLNCKLLSFAA
jgi:hypothetical protein